MSTEAADVVRQTLMASIPPGSPSMFKKVVRSHSSGRGRSRVILADLVMFDDQPGSVKLEPFQWGWSIQWMHLPGGAISLEGDEWVRIPEGVAP